MNLLRNCRQAGKDRFGRTAGCTHMTELSYVLPTVAVQTMANRRRKEQEAGQGQRRPFQLEGCHALRLDGPVAREFYRSEEHTSELQTLMRISYAVFCLKKKKH